MRVPEDVRKTVVFLGRLRDRGYGEEIRFVGTGFFVGIPSARKGKHYLHLVTAKHVADPLSLGDWIMRINTKDGRLEDVYGKKDHPWWFHPTESESVDAAVTFIRRAENADLRTVNESSFVSDEDISKGNIGPGDQVFIAGLFNKMRGQSRNLPVVRTGNVALIPDPGELVPDVEMSPGVFVDAEAYLIEARSIGGLSGSPVFVRETVELELPLEGKDGLDRPTPCQMPGAYYLLGLAHGHWDVRIETKNEADLRFAKRDDKEAVNLGLAVVVPAKKIREILYQPKLVAIREEYDRKAREEEGTTIPD